jgi:hypothetical protein
MEDMQSANESISTLMPNHVKAPNNVAIRRSPQVKQLCGCSKSNRKMNLSLEKCRQAKRTAAARFAVLS